MQKYSHNILIIGAITLLGGGIFWGIQSSTSRIIDTVSAQDTRFSALEGLIDTYRKSFIKTNNLYPNFLNPEEQKKYDTSRLIALARINTEYTKSAQTIATLSGSIAFLSEPKLISPLGIMPTLSTTGSLQMGTYSENDMSYREVATLKFDDGRNGRLFFASWNGFYTSSIVYYFVEYDGLYYFIPSISYQMRSDTDMTPADGFIHLVSQANLSKIRLFEEKKFLPLIAPHYTYPKNISFQVNNKTYELKLVQRDPIIFSPKNLRKLDSLSATVGRNMYIETSDTQEWLSKEDTAIENIWKNPYDVSEKLWNALSKEQQRDFNLRRDQARLFASDGIFLEMPDHTIALYTLVVPFLEGKNSENAKLSFKPIVGNSRSLMNYGYHDSQSCGIKDGTFMNIPNGKFRFEEMYVLNAKSRKDPSWRTKNPQDIKEEETISTYKDSDLKIIGTSSGETLYGFKNINHPFLRALYEYGYLNTRDGGDRAVRALPYLQYARSYPIFFWKDPFGRMVLFIGYSTMTPSACAAKPVIYLYPEEEMLVQVKLDWKKKLLTSIPEYGNGWDVKVQPDGKIIQNRNTYPYLFWEDLITYPKPETGFLVEREDVMDFLDEKLTFLGLSSIEIKDFIEYWIPHMQEYPYYRISFLTTNQMQKSAPITVTPKPDSIQRVFMDFEGLREPRDIEPQVLTPFTRTGFSVIEWGGKKQ